MLEVVQGVATQHLRQKQLSRVTEERQEEGDSPSAGKGIQPPRYTQVVGLEYPTLGDKMPECSTDIHRRDDVFHDQGKWKCP